ncbi:MAG: 30S ribosomal protein S4 [Anaerolineae bacterium]|nr:30S ribosomal protein S4 [Anaerolineae bacterium]MDL1895816.1 30S ribosomal protein S4 [Anaerolineae bacterium CFX7]RIK34558.1 MAG: 30S ribosomal protein S4 [Chloroflexota bacterium]
MARYIGPVCKLCRREGEKLYLKGERCFTPKCAIEKRNQPPGQHGASRTFRKKVSDYGIQLREKQKARRIYGVLERQFRRYYADSTRRSGVTGAVLLQYLESRLDNVVFRLGFASSRKQARQLIDHGHFSVNGRKVTVPSYLVKPGDKIAVAEGSRKSVFFAGMDKELKSARTPGWLTVDAQQLSGSVLNLPSREQIDTPLKEQLIIEFYSR